MRGPTLQFKVIGLVFTLWVLSACNVQETGKSKLVGQNANAPTQTNFTIFSSTETGINEFNRTAFSISGNCSEIGNPVEVKFGPLVQTTTCTTDLKWSFSLNLTLVNDGTINFVAKEYRPNGARPTASHTAYKDSTDPVVTGMATTNYTLANSKTFTWGCSEANCTYRFAVSADPNYIPTGAFSSTATYTDNVRDGVFYIIVQAKDPAGNISAVAKTHYVIDTTPPTISGLSTNTTRATTTSWTWTLSDNWSSSGNVRSRFVVDQVSNTAPTGSYNLTPLTASQTSGDGNWYIHVQALDEAGNESSVVHVYSVLDNTPPANATLNGMGSSPTIDTTNRTLSLSAPGDATHYKAIRVTSAGACTFGAVSAASEVAIATTFDFVVDEGYSNIFCWITRDSLSNWQTTPQSATLVANFPSGIVLPMQGACPTGWTEFTQGQGRILVGAGSVNIDQEGYPLSARSWTQSGGLEYTSGIPANTNVATYQTPGNNLVYRAGNGYNLYADAALADTELDQEIPSDANMPPYYVVRFCRKN